MFKYKKALFLIVVLLAGVLFVGCSKDNNRGERQKVTISGSTSVGAVMEPLVEEYKKTLSNDIDLEVQQIGSSSGIKNTIEGTSEIGMTSRDLKGDEKKADLSETKIALDAIAIITNGDNKVSNLTKEQVKDIFTGKISNWKELGGHDRPIVVVSREDGSGTREGFESIVGYGPEELIKSALISDGSGNIKTTVSNNKNAIGYISLGYVDKSVKSVSIDGVVPSNENVKTHKYAISRPFLLIYKDEKLTEEGQKFIDYILGEDGQKVVEKHGFVSIK
ncbi:phosphate ABC transporter substrate-binding protein [Metaclostridioides mangenotii]|uniref:Phosphate-binding protein n=1 Tax=Metaclostridioides mangenotii TaxID=1540 RepID=A0ABS4EAM9_9FIRM|nr:phosphate ABC transporter substrate-binding protein [Clostridioides mangenotii]MBP1854968.1 phosphate transport system substrate-binding protein [Clostridioides mangenotii]